MPAASISSDDDTHSTKESDGKYNSEHDPDVDMRMEDDVDAPCSVDLDRDMDVEKDGDDDEEEDEEEEDEEEKDEEEEEEEEEDEVEEQDEDEDDGKEPQTIGQGEMVNTSADNVDTMVDNQAIVPPEQGLEMRELNPRPQPPAPAPQPQSPEPHPLPRTPETHQLGGRELMRLVTPQKPCRAVPTLQEAEAAGKTSDVDVDQQLLGEMAGDNTLPNVHLPVAHPDDSGGKD